MILIVEDEPYIGENISLLCAELGLGAILVTSGTAALRKAREMVFKLLIVDLRLPGMSGLEIVKRVRKLGPPNGNMPIIVQTGDSHDAMAEALIAGANAAIQKPYTLDQLRRRIREQLDLN